MAIDKVRPLKIENPSEGGTQTDPFPTEMNPAQDYVAAAGVSFENSDTQVVDLNGSGSIQFIDALETSPITVTQLKTAVDNTFDNSSNGFTASNVQTAIEEAKATAQGFPRFGVTLMANGAQGNGDWITYNELLPNTKVVFPVNTKLDEITFSNNNSDVEFDLQIFKNGILAGNLVYTAVFNTGVGIDYGIISSINLSFVAGDWIRIKYIDQGDNTSDLVVVLWASRNP